MKSNLSDINELSHPFHLHGTNLYVMESGQNEDDTPITIDDVEKMIEKSKLRRFIYAPQNLHPMKDTITIPSNGFTRFRFKADNPGKFRQLFPGLWFVEIVVD